MLRHLAPGVVDRCFMPINQYRGGYIQINDIYIINFNFSWRESRPVLIMYKAFHRRRCP